MKALQAAYQTTGNVGQKSLGEAMDIWRQLHDHTSPQFISVALICKGLNRFPPEQQLLDVVLQV